MKRLTHDPREKRVLPGTAPWETGDSERRTAVRSVQIQRPLVNAYLWPSLRAAVCNWIRDDGFHLPARRNDI